MPYFIRFFLVLLGISGIFFNAFSQPKQSNAEDSLTKVLKTAQDTDRVMALYKLSHLSLYNKPDKALQFGTAALQLATKLNFKKGIASSQNNIGNYYYATGNYKEAVKYHQASLSIRRERKDSLGIAQSLVNIGNALYGLNRLKEAVDTYFKGLKFSEGLKRDDLSTMLYSNIASIYLDLHRYEDALTNNFKAIKIREAIKDLDGLAFSYNNVGATYRDMKKYDQALVYLRKAVRLAEQTRNTNLQAYTLLNMGDVYSSKGNYKLALDAEKQALDLQELLGDKLGTAATYSTMGSINLRAGNLNDAESSFRQTQTLGKQLGSNKVLAEAYDGLTQVYEKRNNFKQALYHHKVYTAFKDSLLNESNTSKLSELHTRYETEKKEKEIRLLNKETTIQKLSISRRNLIIAGIILLFVILAVMALLFYKNYKVKQDARLKQEIITQQDIAMKAVLQAEENERKRIGSDLHDGLGQLFAAVKMNFSSLLYRVPIQKDEDRMLADRTLALVDQSCQEVRSISHQMMPNALLKSGLASGVRNFLSAIDQRVLRVNLDISGFQQRLESNVETVLYRVIQETVNNVIKHSGASQLNIQLIEEENCITAIIEDNGRGFDSSESDKFDGMGLRNIVTRVSYLKGTVDFDSVVGQGTVIRVCVPAQ